MGDSAVSGSTSNHGLRAIDLFCGAGGLTAGFKAAGYEVVLGVDNDSDATETYRNNHPEAEVVCADLKDLGSDDLRDLADGAVDVVLGGPSCQSFSTAGRQNGWVRDQDPRNNLWSHMHGIVDDLEPKAFVMENVPGMLYYDKGSVAKEIFAAFGDLGYDVHHEIILVANFNVPQLRRRLFIVGTKKGAGFDFPPPPRLGGWRRDSIEKWEAIRQERGLLPHITAWEAIADLPSLDSAVGEPEMKYRTKPRSDYAKLMRGSCETVYEHQTFALHGEQKELVKHVPPGGTWRDIPPHLLPDRFRGMRRTDGTNLYGRLDPDRPSYTITTKFNNVTTGCFTHPYEDRPLSLREGARLQSFPDAYRFEGSLTSRYRLVGNAVPPLMAQALGRQLAASLLGLDAPKPLVLGGVEGSGDPPKAPPPSSAPALKRMRSQRTSDTGPEVAIRKELFSRGLRYRKNHPVPGKPRREIDIAFLGPQVAVFVHGCFWHGCEQHARRTKSHTKWWADKIDRNAERDLDTQEHLKGLGWLPLVVWEHEDPMEAADRVEAVVLERMELADAATA